ncbi:MAG: hypothetical protein RL722_2732, partial [Pseudomonadota bacterium]
MLRTHRAFLSTALATVMGLALLSASPAQAQQAAAAAQGVRSERNISLDL